MVAIIKPNPVLAGITYLEWTQACTEEELFQNLVNYKIVEDRYGSEITIYPYRQRAEQIMHQVPVYEPVPTFNISLATLTPEVRSHLEVFVDTNFEERLEETVLNAVGRVFENINSRYYHRSVRKHLRVTLSE